MHRNPDIQPVTRNKRRIGIAACKICIGDSQLPHIAFIMLPCVKHIRARDHGLMRPDRTVDDPVLLITRIYRTHILAVYTRQHKHLIPGQGYCRCLIYPLKRLLLTSVTRIYRITINIIFHIPSSIRFSHFVRTFFCQPYFPHLGHFIYLVLPIWGARLVCQ